MDAVTLALAKKYIRETVEGMGAIEGKPGPEGPPGKGVPAGGDAGQLLAKASGMDYDTHWVDPPEGGGGVTIVSLTLEEYNSLPEEEKGREDVYYAVEGAGDAFDGAGAASGGAQEAYSTEEQRIGTWIDGRPLYRKVFPVACPPVGGYQVVIPANLLQNVVIQRLDGYLHSNSNSSGGAINFAYSRAYIATWNYGGAIYMETNNADYANSPANIIVEYTKTTDQEVGA